ncbi:MAG: hypothetical protein ABW321_29400 [Polyangiales bacterium]
MATHESLFHPILDGKYMSRDGGARDATRSEKKVCLVATDKAFLIELLYAVSLRADCCTVKYSVAPRDGMYLARCFMSSDAAAARLCAEYKPHPKLMVTLQDDDFYNTYRNR